MYPNFASYRLGLAVSKTRHSWISKAFCALGGEIGIGGNADGPGEAARNGLLALKDTGETVALGEALVLATTGLGESTSSPRTGLTVADLSATTLILAHSASKGSVSERLRDPK